MRAPMNRASLLTICAVTRGSPGDPVRLVGVRSHQVQPLPQLLCLTSRRPVGRIEDRLTGDSLDEGEQSPGDGADLGLAAARRQQFAQQVLDPLARA